MTRIRFVAALAAALFSCAYARALEPTKQPVSPAGTRATIDVPAELHIRNTGGLGRGGPGTGAGLCVPTSIQLAARYQGLTEMEGYQKWCMSRPGGSWPQKTANDIREFCKQKGVTPPRYVQHTGGDTKFLELIYRTRRAPAQTWTSAHMVTGAHLDAASGCVIDNNRPGNWLWQSRAEYLRQWNADGPGWVFCWLAPPPPPGREGVAPAPLPPSPFDVPDARPNRPRCPGPNCPRWQRVTFASGEVIHKLYDADGTLRGVLKADGWHVGHGDGWVVEPEGEVPADAPPLDDVGGGIDFTKIDRTRHRYWVDGVEVTQAEAVAAVVGAPDVLTDDSGNYHLSVVVAGEVERGAAAAVLAHPKLAELVAKCHVQIYARDSWVARTRLDAAVTLHEPAPRGGKVVGTAAGCSLDELLKLLRPALDPTWKPEPPPAPAPKEPAPKEPAPKEPGCPNCPACPKCAPKQEPAAKDEPKDAPPAAPPQSFPWLAIAAAIAGALGVRGLKK